MQIIRPLRPAAQLLIGCELLSAKLRQFEVECVLLEEMPETQTAPGLNIIVDLLQDGKDWPEEIAAAKKRLSSYAQGYCIFFRKTAAGKTLYILGTDPVGALCGCVTTKSLCHQNDGQGLWRTAEIIDWPDCRRRWLASPQDTSADVMRQQLFNYAIKPDSPEFKQAAEKQCCQISGANRLAVGQ